MNIQKNLDNAVLTLTLQGRLDAITAPLLNEVVENELTGVKKLILDFGFVEYVSSAGLRVILTAQDIMDEPNSQLQIINYKLRNFLRK